MRRLQVPTHNPFTDQPNTWWDPNGPFWTLHAINPIREQYIRKYINKGNALDIGCGGGILSEALSESFNILGIDTDERLIEIAKARNSKASYDHNSLDNILSKHTEPFDLITCLEVLEHVNNPQEMVSNIAKITKPDGYVFFSTLNRNPISFLGAIVAAEHIIKILPKNTHEYEAFIKPSELTLWAEQSGLKLIDMRGILYNPLTKHFWLGRSTVINYIACFQKSSSST